MIGYNRRKRVETVVVIDGSEEENKEDRRVYEERDGATRISHRNEQLTAGLVSVASDDKSSFFLYEEAEV